MGMFQAALGIRVPSPLPLPRRSAAVMRMLPLKIRTSFPFELTFMKSPQNQVGIGINKGFIYFQKQCVYGSWKLCHAG